jgi:hypothetical protein
MVEQPFQVVGQVPVAERITGVLGLAVAARVPRDEPAADLGGLDLGREHPAVHEDPVCQHDGHEVPACVFVVDPLAVDFV